MAEKEGIRYALAVNLVTSFTKEGKRCLRYGKGGPRAPLEHVVQLVAPGTRAWKWAKVWWITLSPEYRTKWPQQPPNYFVVAETKQGVESYLQKRYVRIARKWMGAAQYAIKRAQQAISTKAVPSPARMGTNARRTAESNLCVRSFGSIFEWNVRIDDNLEYAAQALKRPDAVQFAMAKAANSIAGMLRARAGAILDPDLETPFPEIARIRRGA